MRGVFKWVNELLVAIDPWREVHRPWLIWVVGSFGEREKKKKKKDNIPMLDTYALYIYATAIICTYLSMVRAIQRINLITKSPCYYYYITPITIYYLLFTTYLKSWAPYFSSCQPNLYGIRIHTLYYRVNLWIINLRKT